MSLKYPPELIGTGDNRRGSPVQPVPYPPNPGDGDNIRGATKPENIPAGMYGPVPPISWSDSGIPGIFVRVQNAMYPLKPLVVPEIAIGFRITTEEGSEKVEVAEVAGKLRFSQKKIIEDFTVNGLTSLDMSNFPTAKLVYVTCDSGTGTVKFNGGYPFDLTAEDDKKRATYAFFNYSGGPSTVLFDGACVVDILLFQ